MMLTSLGLDNPFHGLCHHKIHLLVDKKKFDSEFRLS
jgi:hypothetical protein